MKRMITCIVCPMGCTMAVEMKGEEITVVGNAIQAAGFADADAAWAAFDPKDANEAG